MTNDMLCKEIDELSGLTPDGLRGQWRDGLGLLADQLEHGVDKCKQKVIL